MNETAYRYVDLQAPRGVTSMSLADLREHFGIACHNMDLSYGEQGIRMTDKTHGVFRIAATEIGVNQLRQNPNGARAVVAHDFHFPSTRR